MKKSKIYIWGAGRNGKRVLQILKTENCQVAGFIDNNPDKQGKKYEDIAIVSSKNIDKDYDFIIISIFNQDVVDTILCQLRTEGFNDTSKVIIFFDASYCDNPQYTRIIEQQSWKILLLEQKIKKLEGLEKLINAKLDNLGYEIIDKYNRNLYQYPKIGATEEAIDKIVNNHCSMVRYGDGEFEFMAGKERLVYQKCQSELTRRLKEIVCDRDERLLIGIADNYGKLDIYTNSTADGIRQYMTEETRQFHMSVLETDRVYYDAYMFKCYMGYKNKEDAWKRIELVKKIWKNRDVVLVEGDKTRTGCGNDLFDNVKSLKRILVPTSNAFDKYEEILRASLQVSKDSLILAVLGPTANLLVYDLMKEGYQAVDIGQIDMDYQWYKMGAEKRMPIPDRYVSQLPPVEIEEINDPEYLSQIIERIG